MSSIRRNILGAHVLRHFLGKALPLRQPASERLDKDLVTFAPLGLSCWLCRVWQRRRDREPETHE